MRRLLIQFFLLANALVSFAQNGVKGRVVEADGTPVIYAAVMLESGKKMVAGGMTGEDGTFFLSGQYSGKYLLKINAIGYKDLKRELECSDKGVMDLGNIILALDATLLNEAVVVAGETPKSVSVEKTRIITASSAAAATGSVLEVIRGASAVSVDGSGGLSIRGNSHVLILLDGLPTTLGGLESIPAANVQSIEIVTSPDVKYDSEGTGGIVNIISKKQSANMFSAMAAFNYGFNGFLNGNVALNFNKGRWGVRFNYNGKYEKDLIESELHRQIVTTGARVDQLIHATKRTSGQNAGINIQFKATPKDFLTADFKVALPRMNNFQDFNGTRQTDITFNRENFEGGLSYKHLFDPGKKELSLNASVSSITGHRPSFYYEAGKMVQKSQSGGHPLIATLQADYLTMLGKGKFETGVKMTYRQNSIDHKMYEWDEVTQEWALSIPLSNDLTHREYIPAAYAMYSGKFSENLTYKAGVRLEYSYVSLHSEKGKLDDSSDCWFLAPSVSLNWRVAPRWSLSAALTRRISRPTYPQLNPYINLIDKQTYETGNMQLQPEKANKLDAGYSYTGKYLTVNGNAYVSYTTDFINQVAYLDNDILITTYLNADSDVKTGIDHTIRYSPVRWLTVDLASNTFYSASRGSFNGTGIRNQGWTNNSNAGLTIRPFNGTEIQAQYFVTSPQYFPQFTTRLIHYGNIGVKQYFLKDSLTLSALLTDVFNTRSWDVYSDNPVFTLVNNSKNRSRVFWLGITWNFHSFKPAKGGQKQQEEDRSVIRIGD
ncbi:MAG: TonB-dependent receptor [Bacteroidales bacterium]|nr:TonB-dependent receptor [Bacteroidales bacterium]